MCVCRCFGFVFCLPNFRSSFLCSFLCSFLFFPFESRSYRVSERSAWARNVVFVSFSFCCLPEKNIHFLVSCFVLLVIFSPWVIGVFHVIVGRISCRISPTRGFASVFVFVCVCVFIPLCGCSHNQPLLFFFASFCLFVCVCVVLCLHLFRTLLYCLLG